MSTPIRRGIYGKLAGDSTLTNLLGAPAAGFSQSIYFEQAPSGATFPFVIFSKSSGVPTDAFGLPSAIDTDVWLVKGVDRSNSADTAEAIAARTIVLLNDGTFSIAGKTLIYLRKQSDLQYPEVVDGVVYQHCGSLFRLMTT